MNLFKFLFTEFLCILGVCAFTTNCKADKYNCFENDVDISRVSKLKFELVVFELLRCS